jgi:RecA-family ATPase
MSRVWNLIEAPPDYDDIFDCWGEPGRIQFLSPDECVAQPPRDYIVKGLIAPGDVGCIFGMPGFGKSALSPLVAYLIALGESIFGLRTKPGPALYIAAEDAPGMINRVRALRQRYPNAPEFCLVTGIVDLLADGPDQKAIVAKIAEMKPSTVWIDTLAMAFVDLDEIDNKEMNRVVKVCRQFTAHGAAVIVIHHPPNLTAS